MNIQDLKERCESSKTFKEYEEDHKDNYLYALFSLFEATSTPDFQLGYYSKSAKKAHIFEISDEINGNADDKIFGDVVPKPLLIEVVKIDFPMAISKAKQIQEKYYKKEMLLKTLAILQNLDQIVWNITFFTQTFSTINVKINALNGEVLDHSLGRLFDFDKGKKE